ncbi:pantetheine-phosphate adenylyltransferase [Liquorilactobacillus mali]|uniref:Phosphopantetheine adenylyltransferase n=1 Tax=Liquorilactobacillus mali KCTC 3596 = DSM 20444 TaxID=1046596 RepID=J0L555_9LACO|nr:pantetheine-phosphate adenylyltransferase [Liquorilactobacillus mali]EJE99076.1 phosphopantetheine adenylyltransferase [Liquorilactobacillus mali KCTC 3596 = DSM 20444]KRN10677.1 phosphopantetheine adenylyltransferase [Liquorilactobacillus mali KCTC 3596 = DSM 20444]MDC7951985.1 pantetheine-phosphate adenylyltransferase [Liquorilactobacillus mali]MDV7757199.1 pantetheine-phosphate adenylyltransferase [Liquorilactobacillus mali]QFQ74920.1 pantetheine-phosphate adenylyltransferase [Liquorilac
MKAIFPGSFDPITCGHIDLIKRASLIFDEIVVLVMTNTSKSGLFSSAERVALIKNEIQDIANVTAEARENVLTVQAAKDLEAQVILRGLRSSRDFLYETDIAAINKKLNPTLETLFLPTNNEYGHISSSLIKEVAKFDGNLDGLVPPNVQAALKDKLV